MTEVDVRQLRSQYPDGAQTHQDLVRRVVLAELPGGRERSIDTRLTEGATRINPEWVRCLHSGQRKRQKEGEAGCEVDSPHAIDTVVVHHRISLNSDD